MAARDILLDVATEFTPAVGDAAASDRLDRFLARAAAKLDPAVWGDSFDEATALLAAHQLALSTRGADQVGPVVSEKVGQLATSYANPTATSGNMDPLAASNYGMQFLQLRSTLFIGGILL